MAHRKKALCACLSYIGLMLFNSYAYAEEVSFAPSDGEVIPDSAVALYEPLESDTKESENFEISTPESAAVLSAAAMPRVEGVGIGERLAGDYGADHFSVPRLAYLDTNTGLIDWLIGG